MIYFAHPVTEYGTDLERRCLEMLSARGPVLNPNAPEHQSGYEREGMVYFKKLTMQAGECAFLRFPNCKVGAGVAQEAGWFLSAAKPVYEITKGGRDLFRVYHIGDVMSIEETRALIREIRAAREAA